VAATLSPDTDRKLVELAILSGVLDARAVDQVDSTRSAMIARGEQVKTLAEMLVDSGHLDRAWASTFLGEVRNAKAQAESKTEHLEASGVAGYTILGELGRGGMGRVYRARHTATGAERALKVMTLVADPEALARFQREMEALARAAGEGVLRIHESGTERGRPWYAMAVMPGGSLRGRLAERGRFPWPEAIDIVSAVGPGLARCHAAGLIHRDLKPENILFDEEDRPTIADFGCARDLASKERLTVTGEVLGTLDYMAPEQIEGKKVTQQADVHALGSILYELVTGEKAFPGATSPYGALVARDVIPSARARVAEVPEELEAVLARALARRLEDRYATVAELLEGLRAVPRPRAAERTSFPVVALVLVLAGGLALLAGLVASRAHRAGTTGEGVAPVPTNRSVGSPPAPAPPPPPQGPALLGEARKKELASVYDRPSRDAIDELAAIVSACAPADRKWLLDVASKGVEHIDEHDADAVDRCVELLRVLRSHDRGVTIPSWFMDWAMKNGDPRQARPTELTVAVLCECIASDSAEDQGFLLAIYELGGRVLGPRAKALAAVSELAARLRVPAAAEKAARAYARYAAVGGDFDHAMAALDRFGNDARFVDDITTDLQKFTIHNRDAESVDTALKALAGGMKRLPALASQLSWVRIFVVAGAGGIDALPEGELRTMLDQDFEAVQSIHDERIWWAYHTYATIVFRRADADARAMELFRKRDALLFQPDEDDRQHTELAPACLRLLEGDIDGAARYLEKDLIEKGHAPEARAATTPQARLALARRLFPWRNW